MKKKSWKQLHKLRGKYSSMADQSEKSIPPPQPNEVFKPKVDEQLEKNS